MALQTSGAISLANIQTEFGGSNPISLSEYYGVASGVPGSGAISLGDFYGKSSYTAISGVTASPNPSLSSGYRYNNFITVTASSTASASNGTGSYTYSWSYVNGTTTNVTTSGTNTATMSWSRPVPPGGTNGAYYQAVWRCTVSDGTSSGTVDVTFGVRNTANPVGGGGGGGFGPQ
jgi:hypothetical protein